MTRFAVPAQAERLPNTPQSAILERLKPANSTSTQPYVHPDKASVSLFHNAAFALS